jgi:hypothetical protein
MESHDIMHMKCCTAAFINQNQYKWVLALRYITVAPQTDPIKYGIGRLKNDVIVNITVYSEVKFYPVKVKLVLNNYHILHLYYGSMYME